MGIFRRSNSGPSGGPQPSPYAWLFNRSPPIIVDASERHQRWPQGGVVWHEPYPPIIGALGKYMPLQDMLIYQGAFRTAPFGPGTTELPRNMQWQMQVPNMNKYSTFWKT
jgi:hypothetical protein